MKNQNDFSRKFTEDDGFQVAFAVIDNQSKDYSDVAGRQLEEYLKVKVSKQTFNYGTSDGELVEIIEIEHHACSDSELGLDDSGETKFNKIVEESLQELKNTKHLMRCFDHS